MKNRFLSTILAFFTLISNAKETTMQLTLTIDSTTTYTVTLEDNATAQSLLKQLPLTLPLSNFSDNEKIVELPRKLDTTNAPTAYQGTKGDLTYYAPWGNLVLFYGKDGPYASGLIYLGKIIENDLTALAKGTSITITVKSS